MAKRAAPDGDIVDSQDRKRHQTQTLEASTDQLNCPSSAQVTTRSPLDINSPTALGLGPILPNLFHVRPWTSSEITTQLPPLPKVLDPQLEETAFRHPGITDRLESYERLEWLGDAYLELIASSLIFQTFPRTPSGRCSQLREVLIRNTTLAGYFRRYGMQSRAQLPPDFSQDQELARGRSSDKDLLKTQADMFEAFFASIVLSDPQHGLANAVSWIRALWAQTIADQIRDNEKLLQNQKPHTAVADGAALESDNRELNPKDRLRAAIGAKGVFIRYEDMPCNKKDKTSGLPLFTVGVYLDGWGEQNKLLGMGTALRKKEAGQKAAHQALQNRKMMKVFEAKKQAYQEAIRVAEAERAASGLPATTSVEG